MKGDSTITQVGGDPKRLLRQQGVAYDGSGFKPEVPDYLGYVLGMMLLWLVYTGYSSVVGVIQEPDSTISRLSAKTLTLKDKAVEKGLAAKEKMAQVVASEKPLSAALAELPVEVRANTGRGRLNPEAPNESEKGWIWGQIESINLILTDFSQSISSHLQNLFSTNSHSEEIELAVPPPSESGKTTSKKVDDLEYF